MFTRTMDSCYAKFDGETLLIGNQYIERGWSLAQGQPICTNIIDKRTGTEWLAATDAPAVALPNLGALAGAPVCDTDDDCGIAARALKVSLPFRHPSGTWVWTHLIYPEAPFVRSFWVFEPYAAGGGEQTPQAAQVAGEAGAAILPPIEAAADATTMSAPAAAGTQVKSIPAAAGTGQAAAAACDILERMKLSPHHVRWQTVMLRDVTDRHNNLVSEEKGMLYPVERRALQGNLLICSTPLDGNGLIVLKESATPLGQLHYPGYDFDLAGYEVQVVGSGLSPADLTAGETVQAYGVAVGVCPGDETSVATALHAYHRCLRRPLPARDVYIMSNTWGDRSRDSRVNEQFIMAELPVAAELGITIYQIDDGWQKGRTQNSAIPCGVWEGFYAADPSFWEPHPERFPRGLAPVADRCRELGIRLGLWFAPDSTDHFRNWEIDAATLVALHQEYGVTHFKLDGVKLRSKVGEERFVRFMRRVVERTRGEVTFNLDTTAEVRLGYYGRSHYGNLFLENRYTDWHNYFPYRTLRNMWTLARWFPTARLQMEYLNVARNQDKYSGDPIAPAAVGQLFALGATLCANPLAWMEVSGLPTGERQAIAGELNRYRPHQQALLLGTVLPIGEEPNGTSWTGFQSIVDAHHGYLAVYRELNQIPRYRFRLHGLESCRLELEPVAGTGQERRLEVDARGEAFVTMPHPLSFALYRYTRG
jgi:alpha-galactosidase